MNQILLLAALPGALLAHTLEGAWQGTLTPPNQNDGVRLVFKIHKNRDTDQGTFHNLANGRRFGLSFHTEKRAISVNAISIGKNGPAGINGEEFHQWDEGRLGRFGRVTSVVPPWQISRLYCNFACSTAPSGQRAAAVSTGADTLPDLFTAFQEQLGLRLNATKAPVDVLMIDNVSKPSEN